MGFNGR